MRSPIKTIIIDRKAADKALYMVNERLEDAFLHYRRRKVIDAREYRILKLRWLCGRTLDSIGNDYDVSRERIRQLEAKALAKIRAAERKDRAWVLVK